MKDFDQLRQRCRSRTSSPLPRCLLRRRCLEHRGEDARSRCSGQQRVEHVLGRGLELVQRVLLVGRQSLAPRRPQAEATGCRAAPGSATVELRVDDVDLVDAHLNASSPSPTVCGSLVENSPISASATAWATSKAARSTRCLVATTRRPHGHGNGSSPPPCGRTRNVDVLALLPRRVGLAGRLSTPAL